MSLTSLIQKRGFNDVATATVATFATHEAKKDATVATVASVAVANTTKPESEPVQKSWKWRVVFPDGRVIFSHNCPHATREGVLKIYPNAAAVEPTK